MPLEPTTDVMVLIRNRHAVRTFIEKPIPQKVAQVLQAEVDQANAQSGLSLRLMLNEPTAFTGFLAHYGKFSGVANYLVVAGPNNKNLDEVCGYYGEKIELKAAELGLNSCWVALTFSKAKVKQLVAPGHKLLCVIALGYGSTQGVQHAFKPEATRFKQLPSTDNKADAWFVAGCEAAKYAPTALNRQSYCIVQTSPHTARIENKGGSYSAIDLGIVRYHFELGAQAVAGIDAFNWDNPLPLMS
ncbi:nitroreductase family protein [Atopobium fossor]|uniref:nitroreductase family protein n=1 Tax=Atopobium fossor TaxID=39487 RepID=UPI0004210C25|nr:nitroreductase family protein [Atopobium fossor]